MKQKIRKYLCYYRKEVSIGLACICVFLLSLILLLPKSKASSGTSEEIIVPEPVIEEKKEYEVMESIRVDLKGAVANPGVYEMKDGSRVNDVIYQAGGVLENADLSRINLSKRVSDEMVIIIYTKEEIEALKNPETKVEYVYLEPDCTCPDTVNDACIIEPSIETDSITSNKISLNTVTQAELETLPGIGASKAKIIMEYREEKPFETIEELKEIKGIGEKVFEGLKEYITI